MILTQLQFCFPKKFNYFARVVLCLKPLSSSVSTIILTSWSEMHCQERFHTSSLPRQVSITLDVVKCRVLFIAQLFGDCLQES